MTFSNARDFLKMCMSVHNETDYYDEIMCRIKAATPDVFVV